MKNVVSFFRAVDTITLSIEKEGLLLRTHSHMPIYMYAAH